MGVLEIIIGAIITCVLTIIGHFVNKYLESLEKGISELRLQAREESLARETESKELYQRMATVQATIQAQLLTLEKTVSKLEGTSSVGFSAMHDSLNTLKEITKPNQNFGKITIKD